MYFSLSRMVSNFAALSMEDNEEEELEEEIVVSEPKKVNLNGIHIRHNATKIAYQYVIVFLIHVNSI